VKVTTSPLSVSRFSKQCGILNITEPYRPPRCYKDSFTFLYVNDVRASEERHVWPSSVCYGNICLFLYVDNVLTLQETHALAYAACYDDRFPFSTFTLLFYMKMQRQECKIAPVLN
jgi:hypothetical protein